MRIHDFLDYYARNEPGLSCLTEPRASASYAEVAERSRRLGNGLRALGVDAGQRVAVLGENSAEHLVALCAASRLGAVMVPLNHRLAPAELARVIGDAAPQVLLALPDSAATLAAMRPALPVAMHVLDVDAADHCDYRRWLQAQPATDPALPAGDDAALLQLYTSGTTGQPKGVVSSQRNLLSLCVMNDTATPNRASTGMAAVICAPLFHIGGMGSLVMNLYKGVHTVLHRRFDAADVVAALERHPVVNLFLVPAMIAAILDLPHIGERDFSRLRQVFYGASPIAEALLRRAMTVFGCEFIQMYGMTETTGTVVNLSAADHRRALADKPALLRACGRPSVGAAAKIVDRGGRERATGEVGEIWLKSPTNMLGYHNNPAATAAALTDGWVHTGDAGYLDDEGYLYLVDRLKDVVVSGGENIYPAEVERVLLQHPGVAEVAVVGVPDEHFGEALLAFVVAAPGPAPELEALIAYCREHIAGYKIPRRVEYLAALPRNATGKVLKNSLREPYWQGRQRQIG